MSEIDTGNYGLVGVQNGRVTVQYPIFHMAPDQARLHAAWLVAVADVLDPEGDDRFGPILEAVRNT